MKKWTTSLMFLVFLGTSGLLKAQEEDTLQKGRIDFELQLKNNHLWRGFNVTDAPMVGTQVGYVFPGGKWEAGVWAGGGFTGDYREFDYYISYQHKGFRMALWDIYNFSTYMPSDRRIFDYDPATTLHFIDFSVGYNFGEKFPLDVSIATILYGRDRSVIEIREGVPRRADRDRFTTYVELGYPILRSKPVTLDFSIAGAFALSGSRDHFYGDKPNIVNINLKATRELEVGPYLIPASATAMWNPERNFGALQVAFTLF